MKSSQRFGWVAVGLLAGLVVSPAAGQEAAAKAPAKGVVVLDTSGFWRMHATLRPPVIEGESGPRPILFQEAWLDTATPPPPAGWMAPDFADGNWVRAVALRASRTPYLARLCLRGKFEVTDFAKVRGLVLSVDYHGGAVVYVNGKEVARGQAPPGPVGEESLAEGYPPEASVMPDGSHIGRRSVGAEAQKRAALRERRLSEVAIPATFLRGGVNVLAVELLRAPYNKVHEEKKVADRSGKPQYLLAWNSCEIRQIQLTAERADGLVPNATRPAGLQAWNSDVLASDFDLDWGDRCESPAPVRIVGARNGAFDGKFVVGSTEALRGLVASPSDLTGPGGTIPASAIQVRYAIPWGEEYLTIPYSEQVYPYPRSAGLLGALAESAPAEVPVAAKPPQDRRRVLATSNQPEPVFGAVVPVWLTVRVPPRATPGAYTGKVRVEARGLKALEVPVELTVAGWSLPDTRDYRTWVELIQSPDTLAMEYGIPLWSEQHWRMIEQAFRYCGQTGSRVVHVPLLAQTNLGHEQTLVRWVRKPGDGNQFDYDFTILDRYLDAAERSMGAPKMIVFWVWDIYLTEREKYSGRDHLILEQALAARSAMRGTGPMVTVLDRATGRTETLALPPYKDPASKAMWAPVMAGIRERLKARGVEKAMYLGMINDVQPSPGEFQFFAELCPKVPWALHAHGGGRFGELLGGAAPLGYKAIVWTVRFSAGKSLRGWASPNLLAYYDRDRDLTPHTPFLWAHMAEVSITGDQRGIGRLGADYWKAAKDKAGQRVNYVWGRYPHASWRNLDLWSYTLAPGPEGPLASTRLESFREGVQHCEARIFLERALSDKALREKLPEDLAQRCQSALDRRQRDMVMGISHHQMNDTIDKTIGSWRSGEELAGYMWFLGSGWQERSLELYSLAGEVAARLGTQTPREVAPG